MPNDPNSWLEGAFEELKHTVLDKNEDYKIDGEFSNFEFASAVSGVDVLDGLMNQIGIKIGRIRGLWTKDRANNEPLVDSYKDLAGYALITFAYALKTIDDNVQIQATVVEECEHLAWEATERWDGSFRRVCNDCGELLS